MSPVDSLAEWYKAKALRSVPRHHPIEGPYSAQPQSSWGERAIMAVVLVLWVLIALGALQ